VYREKSKFVRKKWKMTLSLDVQFNESAINLLVSRDQATLSPSIATDHEQTWLWRGETPPERARHTIQDREIMVTIAWNPLGFPLIVALPKGCIFNAEYYRDNILAALTQLQPEDHGRKLVVHIDNAKAHTAQKRRTVCEENGLRRAPYPPYSPDLAPPNLFLFGYVQERLKGMVFPSYEELLDAIGEVVTGIEP
jgi:histone-lysine N-methyltransferase SETMAR